MIVVLFTHFNLPFCSIDDEIKTEVEVNVLLNCETVEVSFDCTGCLKTFSSRIALEEHECRITAVKADTIPLITNYAQKMDQNVKANSDGNNKSYDCYLCHMR